jgi:NADH dehydrogenase
VNQVDLARKVVSWADPEDESGECGFDRLTLTAGSVNKLPPIPGVADYAHGPGPLRKHVPAGSHHPAARSGRHGRRPRRASGARCTFVGMGAGYTGTEVAAQGWLLLDLAPRLLPERRRFGCSRAQPVHGMSRSFLPLARPVVTRVNAVGPSRSG